MSERYIIEIEGNPANPVLYLAMCGIFAIVSRFDPCATGLWQMVARPTFVISTTISEPEIVEIIITAFSNESCWNIVPSETAEDSPANKEKTTATDKRDVYKIELLLAKSEKGRINIKLDWWYETLKTDGKIAKSAWKLYAGQQTVAKITRDMLAVCRKLTADSRSFNLSTLLGLNIGLTGRFSFDPRSSRNALDQGYSPNDIKLPIATYPFTELLATIGIQHFFPPRTLMGGNITATRGFINSTQEHESTHYFQYCLWLMPLPITLARVAAIGALPVANNSMIRMKAARLKSRGEYYNLTISTESTSEVV
jgi:CRISPR-associated protein Csb3